MQPEEISQATPVAAETPLFSPTIAAPERDPFWGYTDLLLLLGLLAASLAVIMFGTALWSFWQPSVKDNVIELALPMQFVLYIFVYLCFLVIFKFKYDRGVFEALKWRKTPHSLLMAGLGGILLAFGLSLLADLIHTPKVDTPFDQLVKTPFSMLLLAVTAVLLAPLFEEMLFRGFLQPLLSRTFGVALGIGMTAVLFGGLHASEYQGSWQYVVAITVVGVALGVVRARTDSLIPGAVMHGSFNAVSVVALLGQKYFIHK